MNISCTELLEAGRPVHTKRLTLERVTEEDADFIMELLNSPGWLEFIGDRNVHSPEQALAYIRKIRDTRDLYYWVVRLSEKGTQMGIVSFLKRDYLPHFDIGFAFLPQFMGNGYAQEATEMILEIVRQDDRFPVILASSKSSNQASIKLLNRLGLQLQHELEREGENLLIFST